MSIQTEIPLITTTVRNPQARFQMRVAARFYQATGRTLGVTDVAVWYFENGFTVGDTVSALVGPPFCHALCECVHNGLFATAPIDEVPTYVCGHCMHTVHAHDL